MTTPYIQEYSMHYVSSYSSIFLHVWVNTISTFIMVSLMLSLWSLHDIHAGATTFVPHGITMARYGSQKHSYPSIFFPILLPNYHLLPFSKRNPPDSVAVVIPCPTPPFLPLVTTPSTGGAAGILKSTWAT